MLTKIEDRLEALEARVRELEGKDVEVKEEEKPERKVWHRPGSLVLEPGNAVEGRWVHVDEGTSGPPAGSRVNVKLWPADDKEPLPEKVVEFLSAIAQGMRFYTVTPRQLLKEHGYEVE